MKAYQKIIEIGCVSLIIIFLSACGVISGQNITLNIKESSVNEIIQKPIDSPETPFQISGIDMKDGFIRVFMSYQKQDGSELTGSYDIDLEVKDGQPTATVSNVNMPGLELDRTFLDKISKLIVDDFILASSEISGQVQIKSLNTTEDSVELVVNIK